MRVVKFKILKTVLWWFFVIIIMWVIIEILSQMKTGETEMKQLKLQIEEGQQQYKALAKTFKAVCIERKNLMSLQNKSQATVINNQPPPMRYEVLRRRIYTNIKELWYYVNYAFLSFSIENKAEFNEIGQEILENVAHRKISLLADMESLSEVDGWHEWRKRQAFEVSGLVQQRLHYFQHHLDCSESRICLCNTFRNCGFGCQIHQMTICLLHGYASVKPVAITVVAKFANYSILPIFQPVSRYYCTNIENLTNVADYKYRYSYLPLAVPKDLAARVMGFNGDPASWWIGQLVKFVLKPLPEIQAEINNTITKLCFKTPIVGVHIRRTDKLTEAAYHDVEEYMYHVKDYYDKLEMKKPADERRVYLATDDVSVIYEARAKFPEYKFLHESEMVAVGDFYFRWSVKGMIRFLVDVHLLAMCDFFVGTFSSQIGRLVYEMMQANRVDASESFVSLDDIFFFPINQRPHDRRAIISHAGDNYTISFVVGDFIGVAGNHWNGYGKGINRRTNQSGLFPWYKTNDHLVMYPFPNDIDVCESDNFWKSAVSDIT